MGKFVINGGNKLDGKITPTCAKNSVLPIMAGSILCNDDIVIKNCPLIDDVLSMKNILEILGGKVKFENNDLILNAKKINSYVISGALTCKLRSSVFMLGALLSRFKRAKIALPGGCKIGKRPIDIHLNVFRSFGAKITEGEDFVECKIDKPTCADVTLCFPSVGATENAILIAVKTKGSSIIRNCAREPEIVDLANFLNSMGAKIKGAGSKTITVDGVNKLNATVYSPIKDRIEIGTYLLATAICGGKIEIDRIKAENIAPLISKLCQSACKITIKNDIINLSKNSGGKAFSFATGPYPLFPTDLQAQTMAYTCTCYGESVVQENVFENRFLHIKELIKMGANVKAHGNVAIIRGVKNLHGENVFAEDLRGGASLVLAGLKAEGQTTVFNSCHIERGYFEFDKKLRSLGADIKFLE